MSTPAPPSAAPSTPVPNKPASAAAAPAASATAASPPPAAPSPGQNRISRRRVISFAFFAAIAIVGVLIVLYAWRLPPFTSGVQTTENAYVRGQVTLIGPQLSGYVAEVLVQDFQRVRTGDLLVRIDDRIYRQRLDQAMAQLSAQKAALANAQQQRRRAEAVIAQNQAAIVNAQAQATRATADLKRVEELVADGSLSLRERDQTRAANAQTIAAVEQARAALEISRQDRETVVVNRGSLEAAVESAQAAVQLAEIDLSNTRIVAPRDGLLGQVLVRQGAYVNSGAQLMALVPEQVWVIANLKETQMASVRLGQAATLQVDALNRARLTGHVERISPATGSEFSVLAADNATGNFVKIAQRIPVRIRIDPDQPLADRLRPGMSVVASIDTASEPVAVEDKQ